jgi:serine/threonine-protein kinase
MVETKPYTDYSSETIAPAAWKVRNMIGKTISHYNVLEKLGQGGMGEVFLAEDKKLGRKVALKFLTEKVQQNPAIQKRFVREARSAAAIDHPYICKIYETEEIEGQIFIAMEYVEGQALNDKLALGSLSLKEALRIAMETAEAVEEIHKNRFVHRDLKPSNIMLAKQGHIKVMDFGLARQSLTEEDLISSEETPCDLTPHSSIVGTVAYMSPEQVRRQEVDRQADIFSFGIVLYEMITGVHPFQKSNVYETVSSILHDDPPPLARYRDPIPELLQHTLSKMLVKEPAQRYQSVHEVRTNLGQLLEGLGRNTATLPSRPAVAVLPFADMSPQKDQDYFCDGLAEELINALAKLEGLRVAARTSAFRFRGAELDIREIGRRLNVGTILEGSLRKAGDRLRIGIQLINVENGYPLWSERYERKLDDVFQIQDDISRAVVEELKIALLGGGGPRLFPAPPKNVRVYELYLKGRFCWNKRTEEGFKQSVKHFKEALEQDSDYALAYAGLATSFATLSIYGAEPPELLMPQAKSAAERALDIDERLALARVSLGCVRSVYEWDWAAAESDFRKAIEIEPRNEHAHHWYATNYLIPLGRFDEARSELKLAQELDPLNLIINASVGLPFYYECRYEEAIEEYLNTLEMDPNYGMARYFLGQAYAQKGMYRQAITELERAVLLLQGTPEGMAALAHAYAIAGNQNKAQQLLGQLEQVTRYVSPVLIAQIHAGLHQKDQALECLEEAYRIRSTDLIWLKVRPVFESIRSDPRFDELCKKMGFPT